MLARSGGIAACGLVLALACGVRAESSSSQASTLRHRCEVARELGRFDRAVVLCRRAVHAQSSPENLVALSGALSSRGQGADLDRAREIADRALRVDPRHPAALLQRIQVAGLQQDLEGAETILAAGDGGLDSSREAQARSLIAQLSLDRGRVREATEHARRAVALDPELYEAYAVLARTGLETGDSSVLRIAAPAMLRLSPNGAYSHYVSGVVAMLDSRYGEARAHAERARWLGMEPESCDELLAAIDRRAPIARGALRPMGIALGVGAALLLFLLGASATL
ncbi:MAG: tetratricopeptide repeat protein, partial [Polyangiaceae bacterium]|nr:tetratricopeptide repeat protein [Polyangiaceae bacterium]